jgi:co-chaperonin GroES (HSP10)
MLTPIAKRILIQPIEQKHEKIILSNQKPSQFKVVAIGEEVTKVKVGDTVYLEKHYGIEIQHESEKFQCIDESSILAKVVGNAG